MNLTLGLAAHLVLDDHIPRRAIAGFFLLVPCIGIHCFVDAKRDFNHLVHIAILLKVLIKNIFQRDRPAGRPDQIKTQVQGIGQVLAGITLGEKVLGPAALNVGWQAVQRRLKHLVDAEVPVRRAQSTTFQIFQIFVGEEGQTRGDDLIANAPNDATNHVLLSAVPEVAHALDDQTRGLGPYEAVIIDRGMTLDTPEFHSETIVGDKCSIRPGLVVELNVK